MPVAGILLLVGVLLVLVGIFQGHLQKAYVDFAYGVGVTLAVTALFLITGLNGTAFYPSFSDLSSSLLSKNASSSHYTLGVMAYVSLLVPFVLAYIVVVWRAIDSKKITQDEIKNDHHAY